MPSRLDLPPISVIRDPEAPIPKDLLHPHYDNPRFQDRNLGRIVFMAPDVQLAEGERMQDAYYMESEGYALWNTFSRFEDEPVSRGLTPNSANFFEVALNDLWPRLDENCTGIAKFGRDIPGLRLLAITSSINGMNLYSRNEFVVIPRT